MSVQAEITRLRDAAQDIVVSVGNHGVTIPPTANLDDYASYIDQISGKDNSMIDNFVSGTSDTLSSDTVTSIGAYRFYAFSHAGVPAANRLLHVDFPNVETINQYAFGSSTILEAVFPKCTTMSGSSTFLGSSITRAEFASLVNAPGTQAFRSCASLTSVDFPKLAFGGQYMFQQCNALLEATFPSLIAFGYQMFINAANFAKLTLPQDWVVSVGAGFLNQTPFASGGGAIYVNPNQVTNYKANAAWALYADRIFPIP